MIKIEKGVPLPMGGRSVSGVTATMRAMAVGDSFEITIANKRFSNSAHCQARLAGIRVTVRKTGPDTYRVWRIEDKQ